MTRPDRKSIGRCPITGKAEYTRKADAKAVARYYNSDCRVFRCDPGCGFWHLGSPGRYTREQHQANHARKVEQWQDEHRPGRPVD